MAAPVILGGPTEADLRAAFDRIAGGTP
jgi:hypothetical protein